MKKVSSFKIYKIQCPVCGTLNQFRGIRPKAYVETRRDTDFCPVSRDWQDSRHQVKNPLLYFMATCKQCFFTHELNKELVDWKNNQEFKSPAFVSFKKRHLQELDKKDGIIKKMGKALKPSIDPFSSAVLKFLLGIYDENLKPVPSNYNLGRYYLRVGWVFREEKDKEKSAWIRENLTFQSLDQILESIHDQHKDYLQKIRKLKDLVEFEFAGCEPEMEKKDNKNRYHSLIDQMMEELTSLRDSVDQLQTIYRSGQHKTALPPENSLLKLENFLFSLKIQWPEIPVNEKEALKLSLDNYKNSLTNDLKGNQRIQISYLIGELSRRIGDLDGAKEYLNLTIDVGQDFIQRNSEDQLKTALAQKILEMAYQQKEMILKRKEKI
ncbi:MAG: DUF2225 domain-containing protein [Candidatus Zixiibacteriota bacterium]